MNGLKMNSLPINQIILGKAELELATLPPDSVDLIIADPPYNLGKDYGNNKDKKLERIISSSRKRG
jgi:DNA modification methylase